MAEGAVAVIASNCGASVGARMDPRVARSHAAVMDAARELLVELGPEGFTIDAVVARSGVAKSTVYRHWKTRDDLVDDVFAQCLPRLDAVAPGVPAMEALRQVTHQFARSLSDPWWQRLLPAMLLERERSEPMSALDAEMKEDQHRLVVDVFGRCVDAGLLDAVVLDEVQRSGLMLVGPLLAVALSGGDIDDSFVDEIVNRFVRAYAPQP